MCLTDDHFCLTSLQIFFISISAIEVYASYSKWTTFFPSKLFLVVPKHRIFINQDVIYTLYKSAVGNAQGWDIFCGNL